LVHPHRLCSRRTFLAATAWVPAALCAASGGLAQAAEAQSSVFPNGQAGFVVSHIAYALSKDASETGACPDGMTTGYRKVGDIYVPRPDAPPVPGATEDATLEKGLGPAFRVPNTQNYCQNPELGKPDPNWHTVTGKDVPAEGIDLDGQDARIQGKPAPNTCAHDDFRGMNGERGIDNQFFRVVGCSKSFQSTGQSNGFEIEMLTGSWGLLITLKGVDDLRNDNDVEVGLYSNADPIQLSATREPLANATYAIEQDPRFQATTHGRIVNGVLTTDPVDFRFHWIVNSIRVDRPLQDARVRLTFTPDGGLEGILAGYTSIEDMYDFQFGFRSGKDGTGKPSPLALRSVSSIGYALTQGHTCQGAYYALKQNADGHRDPKTGQCTAISTQYRIKAIPAFVVNTATKSINAALDGHAQY
jgi:hypothetical protein